MIGSFISRSLLAYLTINWSLLILESHSFKTMMLKASPIFPVQTVRIVIAKRIIILQVIAQFVKHIFPCQEFSFLLRFRLGTRFFQVSAMRAVSALMAVSALLAAYACVQDTVWFRLVTRLFQDTVWSRLGTRLLQDSVWFGLGTRLFQDTVWFRLGTRLLQDSVWFWIGTRLLQDFATFSNLALL